MGKPNDHSGGLAIGRALDHRPDRSILFSRFDVERNGSEVSGGSIQFDDLSPFQPGPRNSREKSKPVAVLHVEHPTGLHEEPTLFVRFVRAGLFHLGHRPPDAFGERIGIPVSLDGHGVIVGLEKRLHLATLEMNPWVPAVIGLTGGDIALEEQIRVIGMKPLRGRFLQTNDLLEHQVLRAEQRIPNPKLGTCTVVVVPPRLAVPVDLLAENRHRAAALGPRWRRRTPAAIAQRNHRRASHGFAQRFPDVLFPVLRLLRECRGLLRVDTSQHIGDSL